MSVNKTKRNTQRLDWQKEDNPNASIPPHGLGYLHILTGTWFISSTLFLLPSCYNY